MKRRAFLSLFGRSVAAVAAAPIATAGEQSVLLEPACTVAFDPARRIAKAQALGAGYAANPALVMSNDGRRMWLRSTIEHLNNKITDDVVRELTLSTPFDVSTAICEPDHSGAEGVCSKTQ
tara:strand:- start:2863 stop:3225 length:363 start_codon:yes stop_codon:yes gene_type:complete